MSTDKEDLIITPAENPTGTNITFEPPIIQEANSINEIGEPVTFSEPPRQLVEDISTRRQDPPSYYQIPPNEKGPVGNYYAEIKWDNGFEQWDTVRFSTPMDNNCLFHAIANSFFEPYHTEMLNGKHVSRHRMITALRKELAEKLANRISNDENAPTHYSILNGGNTSTFAAAVPEFKLDYMQSQLESQVPIGYGYMEFIGNALNKDIYILEAIRHDIYVTDELPLTIKGNRSSIVLYYMNGHYELVGIRNPDGSFDTHFTPEHSFIRFLHGKVRQITG